MRTLAWQKIPITSVMGKANLWTMVGRMGDNYEMDYTKMDALFSVSHDRNSKRAGADQELGADSKKKKENLEINILDGKRSLNVNIFLKQFRMSHEDIVQLVREGRSEVFGAERLRGLLKLLPSQDEIDAIKAFDGDQDKLGNAEKFFLCMMALPNYRMRMEGLLIMEEFNTNMEWIRPSIEAVIQASKDIQENTSLKELIFLILIAGNYLNSGNYAGNAAGFKLSSLLKLTELRANKPRMNLLHYVAQEAKDKNPKLLDFPREMRFLKDASQVSVETLSQDITNIATKVKAITEQIVVAGVDFQKQMEGFLKEANVEVVELEEDLKEIEHMRLEMATFFAEDQRKFKLEECFTILQSFCERFEKAIAENVQREAQEKKAEQRRKLTEEEKLKRNSKELPDSPNESLDQSSSVDEEDGSIVDMLLADVRSGFTSRKFNDGNFSVQKVTKVNLLEALSSGAGTASSVSPTPDATKNPPSFIRGGYGRVSQRKKPLSVSSEDLSASPTPESALNQRRNRRSYATEDNESLIDFLTEQEGNLTPESPKPENTFERFASLRRRHQERKEKKKNALEVIVTGRELAPSPSIPENAAVDAQSLVSSSERLQPDKAAETKSSRSLRRTRSWLDRPSVDKANSEHGNVESPHSEVDSSDALLDRIKQKLNKKSEDRQVRLSDHSGDRLSMHNNEESSRTSSRWRSGISVPDNSLNTISEKDCQENKQHVILRQEKSDPLKLRYRKSIDPSEFSRAIYNTENSSRPIRSQDDSDMHSPNVAVSVRKKISSGMGTNIDQVLKTIEDSGRTIDTVGVSGPIKRTQEVTDPKLSPPTQMGPHPTVAVVAHVSADYRPSTPVSEQDLKTKRDKRKKRSTLSLDDVKAAMKTDSLPTNGSSQSGIKTNVSSHETSSDSAVYYQASTGKPVAKTPPSPCKPITDTDNSKDNGSPSSKELSKAAKLAAKKKFRDARFGDSSGNSEKRRPKSNVESDGVDQALKEMANRTSMSRSKSYDEHVAKNSDNDFNSGVMKRNSNSGSAPDTTEEKKAVLRKSTSRLSLDGRRNGLYIPSDESDTEISPQDAGTSRLSDATSGSPHSVSQLSLKSTNTSTETLQADTESSPEQRRKSAGSLSQPPANKSPASSPTHLSQPPQVTPTNYLGVPMAPRPQSTTAIDLEQSALRRSYSLMERTRLHNDEEDGDNPLAKMAKWRMNRNRQRRSAYDNVPEMETSRSALSPTSPDSPHPFKTEVNELKNEVGSRSSYASSCASSNERDEGFETGSGTASQRTSMSSTIDSDIYAIGALSSTVTATQPRREVVKSRVVEDKSDSDKSVIKSLPEDHSVMSSLSVEADRKERTETWTEQTIRANSIVGISSKDLPCDSGPDFAALSPDSGHSTSKEDIWSEDVPVKPETKEPKKKSPSVSNTAKTATAVKTKSVPNYMKSTNSFISAKKSARTSTKTSTTSISASSVTAFKRDTPQRISVKEKEAVATIKRDVSMRASMRAESASAGFQRGSVARKSVRGPRSSLGLSTPNTKPCVAAVSPPSSSTRPRSDSTNSASSTASSASTMSANTRRLTTTGSSKSSLTSRPSNPSSSAKASVTIRSKTPVPSTPTPTRKSTSATPNSTTQSQVRKLSTSSVSESTTPVRRAMTPLSHEFKRSSTPLAHEGSRSTTPLPERPKSTTPFDSRGSARRSSFMAPTAASKARKETNDTNTTGLKSKTSPSKSGPLLRTASLRLPKKTSDESSLSSPDKSMRKSLAVGESPLLHRGEHHQSLSTVAEQDEDTTKAQEDNSKKSPSLLKRIGIVKGKPSTSPASKSKAKTTSTARVSPATKK